MIKIPAGLTSSVNAGGKNFILQTEFIASDNLSDSGIISGRIKTTVAVQGQVVHKVEKAYASSGEADDSLAAAEKAVKKQHLQVARNLSADPKEFLASVSELTISGEDRLALIPGIGDVVKVDLANLSETSEFGNEGNIILKNLGLIRDLVVAIAHNTRLGKLQKIVAAVDDNKYVLTGLGGQTFFLSIKDNTQLSTVLDELEKAKS